MPESQYAQITRAFEPWRKVHRRDAWRPVVEQQAGGTGEPRFGGMPDLLPDEAWPVCGKCGRALKFFLQLDLAALPAGAPGHGEGLLQMFYCTIDFVPGVSGEDTMVGCCDFAPFSPAHLLRVLDPTMELVLASKAPEQAPAFPCQAILGWDRFADYPDSAEHDRLGLEYEYEAKPGQTITSVRWPSGRVAFERVVHDNTEETDVAQAVSMATGRDKLGGWPMWIQGVEYPSCPKCATEMQYLFQLDSEDHVPYMFGDVGCGHISQCPNHPDVVAFTWACS